MKIRADDFSEVCKLLFCGLGLVALLLRTRWQRSGVGRLQHGFADRTQHPQYDACVRDDRPGRPIPIPRIAM